MSLAPRRHLIVIDVGRAKNAAIIPGTIAESDFSPKSAEVTASGRLCDWMLWSRSSSSSRLRAGNSTSVILLCSSSMSRAFLSSDSFNPRTLYRETSIVTVTSMWSSCACCANRPASAVACDFARSSLRSSARISASAKSASVCCTSDFGIADFVSCSSWARFKAALRTAIIFSRCCRTASDLVGFPVSAAALASIASIALSRCSFILCRKCGRRNRIERRGGLGGEEIAPWTRWRKGCSGNGLQPFSRRVRSPQ